MTAHAGKNVGQGEQSSTAGGSANVYSHFVNQYGSFSENWKLIHLEIPANIIPGYTQKDLLPYHNDTCLTMLITVFSHNNVKLETTKMPLD